MVHILQWLFRYRTLVMIAFAGFLALGIYSFLHLDIEAYPDPSPPLVEVITQNTAWSAEEMEQQVTVPLETTLNGTPHLTGIRSISIFGLSDIKLYFDFDSDYFHDRQEVLNRLQTATLPGNVQPQISPWSPIGEIYRYQLDGPYSLNELKSAQDWFVRRELKQVPGVIDVTTFGGTTRQYQVEIEPDRLLQYGVTLPQVVAAIQNSNANSGGNYLSLGPQSVNVRGVGLLRSVSDIGAIVLTVHNGAPVRVQDVAEVHEGFQPRLGRVGRGTQPDVVEGIVLLQRGEESLPALHALKEKIHALNGHLLPAGMKIKTIYDRSELISITTATVRHVIYMGLVLVTIILLVFLGDLRLTLITALAIPFSVLFAFTLMVLTGRSANLISLGAIDFGILVDSAIVVLESIFRILANREIGERIEPLIAQGTRFAARPVLYATGIILVAFIPLFTMKGVPGKIFAPMSVTYGFALTGALLFALFIAPVLATVALRDDTQLEDTRFSAWLLRKYQPLLRSAVRRRRMVLVGGAAFLLISAVTFMVLGGEFMPPLEEGNLWIRATLPQDISLEEATRLAQRFAEEIKRTPEVTQVVWHVGRPDDGTDPSTFNNVEISVALAPAKQWRKYLSKGRLIAEMSSRLAVFPNVAFNFSQNIQDNVEEAMSGVKGENSLKLFGDDLNLLTAKADEITAIMTKVHGVEDVGVFKVSGQPNLLVRLDRARAARYGILAADLNAAIQAAVGGSAVTQILDGDRRYDLVVRYAKEYRSTLDAIAHLLVPTPDGGRVPLGSVADVELSNGSFEIFREQNRRYLPIKFSVRGRDLAGTVTELQSLLKQRLQLPPGYYYEWAGEFDSLRKEQHRLLFVVPLSVLGILVLLFVQFGNVRDAFWVLCALPFACTGGVWSLLITHTPFSISAAVGFTSLIGVATLGLVVFLAGVRRSCQQEPGIDGLLHGCEHEMRPVVMACLAAGLGLLPAAVSNAIGAQAQQPLARVVVGGCVTTVLTVLFLLPAALRQWDKRSVAEPAERERREEEVYI